MRTPYLAAALLYMGFVYFLSGRPPGDPLLPPLPWNLDKAAHLVEYALLGWLLARAFGAGWRRSAGAVLVAALYGLTDEFHQSFVPGRDASLLDWAADLAGALAGAWLAAFHGRGASPTRPADGSAAADMLK